MYNSQRKFFISNYTEESFQVSYTLETIYKAEDTWENESSLNCPELLQKFKEESPNKAKKRSSSKSPTKSAKKQKKEDKDYEVRESFY